VWSDEINKIVNINKDKNKSHKFLLTNFNSNLTVCSSCNKYLEGIFFQGFKCTYCSKAYHRECLKYSVECELKSNQKLEHNRISNSRESSQKLEPDRKSNLREPSQKPDDVIFRANNKIPYKTNTRLPINSITSDSHPTKINNKIKDDQQSLLIEELKTKLPNSPIDVEAPKTVIKNVTEVNTLSGTYKEVYKAIEKHEFTTSQEFLNFEKGDFIFVTGNINDHETSKGFKLRFKSHSKESLNLFKEEGIFLKSRLDNFEKSNDLNFFPWYLECERKAAEQILNRIMIENTSIRHIFLVRYNQGKYTITLKFNNKSIKHISLNTELINEIMYYSMIIDAQKRFFTSILDLINFFRINSLKDCTEGLIDVLDIPFREALPLPIYTTKAKVNFEGIFIFRINY